MANDYNYIRGFMPLLEAGKDIEIMRWNVGSGNTVDLFKGSLYHVDAGVAVGIPLTGTEATDKDYKCKGSITALYDTTGRPINSLPASTAGICEGTVGKHQKFIATVDGTGYAGITTEGNNTANPKAETRTASTDRYATRGVSGMQLDSAQIHASENMFVILGPTNLPNNTVATDNVEVICHINPANWQIGVAI